VEGGGVVELIEAIAELREIAARAKDATPIMQEIAAGAASEQRQHFAAELSRGTAMRQLTPAYEKQKRKRYPGKTILRATDKMFSSIVSNAGADFAEAGPTDPKAAFHGDARDSRRLRDPFYVTAEFVDSAEESLVDYVGPRP